jgi:putative ABC transport system permease protein
MILAKLALASAWNRRGTLVFTVLAVALATTLLLGVERLRYGVKTGFEQSISGADLVVGARGSPLQLLLYAVFRLGDATHEMDWKSVAAIAAHPAVKWTIPIALGDSYRGFPVVATNADYFRYFKYGERRALILKQGRAFGDAKTAVFDAVLGAEVAAQLGLQPGDDLALSHGSSGLDLASHADKPFTVVGVLAPTGTPVDRSVHIPLAGMSAIHLDWQGGAPLPGVSIPARHVGKFDLTPTTVTALVVGLKSRAAVFSVKRFVDDFRGEPLMAVLPGVALAQLWQLMGVGERALFAVSLLVVVVGLAGLVAVVLASLGERRRELAVLRANGARPVDVLWLLAFEGLAVVTVGALAGLAAVVVASVAAGPSLQAQFGLSLGSAWPTAAEWRLVGAVVAAGFVASLVPALRAYRMSLSDGLTPRL